MYTSMKLTKLTNLCLIALMLAPLCGHTAIYRYIDANGRLVLTDKPKHSGYIQLVKTDQGWVPKQSSYKLNQAKKKALSSHISKVAKEYKLPAHLIHAVIRAESAYNPNAISKAGAQGIMQLMPATAARFGVKDPFNPKQNIAGGSRYLSYLLKLFNGDYRLALAAYNAGEHAVIRYGNRIPPYKETQNYVRKVLNFYKGYRSS